MQLKRFVLLLVVGCLFVLTASTVLAQLELDETYVAEDESFEFMYPSDWEVDDSSYDESGFLFLVGNANRTDLVMIIVGPETIDAWTDGATSLSRVVTQVGRDFNFDNEVDLTIDDRDAVAANFELEDTSGLAIVIEMTDGGFGAVLTITSPVDAFADIADEIVQIIETFDSVGANDQSSSGGIRGALGSSGNRSGDETQSDERPSADSLNDYDGDWRDAIAELEDLGLIGSGGILIFNENRAFFDGIGSWFTPLARRTSRRDIVMAAELNFNSDSRDFESCSLLARINNDPNQDTVTTFLEVGFDNDGDVYWVDRDGDNVDSDLAALDLDLDEAHHLLFMALDDRLTVYVDGESVFDNVRIQSRSGSFGIALVGRGTDSRCEGTNIWAYEAPIFVPGLCEVTAGGTVNKRSGPGTNYDRAGTLGAGERIEVVGQSEGSDSFTWYELEDGTWVREDVISLQGDCGDVPES